MRAVLHLALSDLVHDPLRTFFSAVGIASVVMVALVLNGMANGLFILLESAPLSTNLVLVDASFIDISDLTIPQDLIDALSAWVPDPVARISPVFYRQIRIDGHILTLLAAEPAEWEAVHRINLVEGRLPAGLREMMVGEGAVTTYDWKIGQKINIYGEDFTITAIFQAPGLTSSALWIPMTSASDLFKSRNVQFLTLNIVSGADLEAVSSELQHSPLLAGKYSVFLEDSYTRRNAQLVRDVYGVFNLVSVLALLAIPLSTYSMTLLTLAERTRALGILRAVGFTHSSARWFLLLRALLLALGAYILGWAGLFTIAGAVLAKGPVIILGVIFEMELTVAQAVLFLGITLVFALAGAFFSSNRQLSLSVNELLKD